MNTNDTKIKDIRNKWFRGVNTVCDTSPMYSVFGEVTFWEVWDIVRKLLYKICGTNKFSELDNFNAAEIADELCKVIYDSRMGIIRENRINVQHSSDDKLWESYILDYGDKSEIGYRCPDCGFCDSTDIEMNFCPNCGMDMRRKSTSGKKNRRVRYDIDGSGVESFWIKGVKNPCGCGSNVYHYELDGEKVIGVCNSCNTDIYEVYGTHASELISNGIWRYENKDVNAKCHDCKYFEYEEDWHEGDLYRRYFCHKDIDDVYWEKSACVYYSEGIL